MLPTERALGQIDDDVTTNNFADDLTAYNIKKNKKDGEESFFSLQIDRLSGKFFSRLSINLIAVLILIRLIYYPNYRKKELFFTYFIFNFIIFLITFFLNKVDMGIGAAFGLFAVFSMLRYRTENISAKDMTYLFLAIAIGLLTAISKASAFELGILNGLILLITFALEGNMLLKKELSKSINYENIDLIKPENHAALIVDLKKRTGLNIHRVAIDKVDFLKDTAKVILYYYDGKPLIKQPGTENIVMQTIENKSNNNMPS
ncbi:MAG: DUF4956 domain-containing protein [Bacteroidetes bacterium]|nr:DUF4956 domain-containing protein [Bacteroidota bacterium]